MSDRTPTPPTRLPFSLAAGALLVGALVVAVVFIDRANSTPPASAVSPTATAASSASPTAVAFADCTTATFGTPLQPSGEPTNPHVYSAPPAMQIDTSKLYEATIKTARGNIVLCLQPNLAPKTVNNFVVLARNHFYDGLTFHRVVAAFVVQGGDPAGTGNGGPGYKFNDEPVLAQYTLGAVAMANSGVNTNGSQFFICIADDTSKLQPLYNLFGKVASGIDVASAIKQGDVMQSVTVAVQQ
ncbi:MAG TPA: peptidylprolyl isomerase [Candidatus Dormibacteraeota bacterium]|nr:peptidylprolyl isomerase [Candidatus Dormibacteraeota bacterium]